MSRLVDLCWGIRANLSSGGKTYPDRPGSANAARHAIKPTWGIPENRTYGSHRPESIVGAGRIMPEVRAARPNDDVEDRYGLVAYNTEGQETRHKEIHEY